ncbi:hypothetical protein NHX12_028835 [Muraenolepis orangiensis]|uniref:PPM-type phosphatase domain-containing protein n=1 Tax=Muraenolepis orangiensis TaxID=630683 RepID=A0A9Q0ECJ1_9TELE|nr:hypothetical protein NHX12_028835 [Muraenolepis orangiensis]
MAEEEVRCFLGRLLEEFPSALGPEEPLPLRPLSRGLVSLEELQGESLELGLRLLDTWSAPPELSALLCQAAVARVLQGDLSPFHSHSDTQPDQDQDHVQCDHFWSVLQSEPFQRFFLNTLREVGVAWQHTPPPLSPSPTSFVPLCFAHAIRNTRRKMEDKHDGVERRYYGVFDGHGGVDAATFASTHLQVNLSRQPTLRSHADQAFKHAFHLTDRMFRDKRLRSGSTAVAVLIQDQTLTLAWLGDSQALLVSQGNVVPLMEPHKPEREDERQRVEDLGGCVTFMGCWRVNGTYAVSRAIGDFDQKPYVSGDADCSTTQLSGAEDYVVLACDGFFDTVSPGEVPRLGVAQKLVSHARVAGSSDNITVMVVFLRPPRQILAQGLGVVKDGAERRYYGVLDGHGGDERQRVEDLGGCVTFMGCWRVNGTYAVSRAIERGEASVDGAERRYYGVLDGHGGVDAATFASTHLQVNLSRQPTLRSHADQAFKHAFHLTDRVFRDKAKRERLRSGSTAVAVLIQDQTLTLAWLGDSQALLVSQGNVVPLMEPHKPEREDERQRVEDLGGCVTFMGCWRVNGTYAVSRAIEDFDQKPYVSGDADCSTTRLSGGGKLVSHARVAGSSDNITVMVVFLRPPRQILAQGLGVVKDGAERRYYGVLDGHGGVGVERRYYGVLDGHGGVDAATFASTHLQVNLSRQPTLRSHADQAFKHAFHLTDRVFRDKAKRERLRSGSTAVAVLIQDQTLTLAWLGDSQALLVSQGNVVPLMEPHKPEREDERQRVEDLGGCVTFMGCWRVNGTYAVSRAIGDFDQKPYVSGDADCSTTQLSGAEDYVVLACDGFFDTVSPGEVPRLVLDYLGGGEEEREGPTPPLPLRGRGWPRSLAMQTIKWFALVITRGPVLLYISC